jgi:hypothetical protein
MYRGLLPFHLQLFMINKLVNKFSNNNQCVYKIIFGISSSIKDYFVGVREIFNSLLQTFVNEKKAVPFTFFSTSVSKLISYSGFRKSHMKQAPSSKKGVFKKIKILCVFLGFLSVAIGSIFCVAVLCGQCNELCGIGDDFIPICIILMSETTFSFYLLRGDSSVISLLIDYYGEIYFQPSTIDSNNNLEKYLQGELERKLKEPLSNKNDNDHLYSDNDLKNYVYEELRKEVNKSNSNKNSIPRYHPNKDLLKRITKKPQEFDLTKKIPRQLKKANKNSKLCYCRPCTPFHRLVYYPFLKLSTKQCINAHS